MASYGSLVKNCSVLSSPSKKVREIQGNGFPNKNRSCSIVLDSSKDSQISALIKRGSPLPVIGRSMTGGGEGPSVAEVANSFPARLLGAIERLRKLSNFLNGEERGRRRIKGLQKKSLEKRSVLSQPDRAFISQSSPETTPQKEYRLSFQINSKRSLKRLPEERCFKPLRLNLANEPKCGLRTSSSRTSPKRLP